MTSPTTDVAAIQRRLFGLTRLARRSALGGLVAATLGAGVTVARMIAASHVVAAVHPDPSAQASWRAALTFLLALVVARACLNGIAEWCAGRVACRITSHLRMRLVDHLVALGPRGLAPHAAGSMVTTAIEGVDALDAYFRRFVPQTLATGIVPLIIVIAVAWIDPVSAIVLAVTGPIIPLFMWLLGTLAAAHSRRQWGALTVLGAQFLDTLQGLSTLVLAGRARDAALRLDDASGRLRVTTMGVLRIAFLSGFVLELAATLGTALVAVSVGVRMLEGWIAFQPGLAVLLLAPEFYLPFRKLGQQHHAGMEGVAAAESIFALLDSPASQTAVGASEPPIEPDAFGITLFCESLRFTYPGAAAPALADVTLTFAPGSLTAIVGPSGAGKSTLASLLLRFLESDAGHISANGVPAGSYSPAAWRRMIALVPQRPHFFDGSILDNLRMARREATIAEVRAAARMAEADGFITALPQGYETPLGEAAARLSSGERQRLAIARALLKAAPVLVLDEPTSSLDSVSEAAITRVIARVRRTCTVIVIAHRLATVRHADQIVVLRDGRVVERGRHDELLRGNGLYAALAGRPAAIEKVA